jgi:hypothetical protein
VGGVSCVMYRVSVCDSVALYLLKFSATNTPVLFDWISLVNSTVQLGLRHLELRSSAASSPARQQSVCRYSLLIVHSTTSTCKAAECAQVQSINSTFYY